CQWPALLPALTQWLWNWAESCGTRLVPTRCGEFTANLRRFCCQASVILRRAWALPPTWEEIVQSTWALNPKCWSKTWTQSYGAGAHGRAGSRSCWGARGDGTSSRKHRQGGKEGVLKEAYLGGASSGGPPAAS
ncbi:unnamed protein product, partial [Gulo gulo]